MSLLEVSDVTKKEGDSFLVKDISFTQEVLQRIAIAGATGSGKTTLLKIIAGLVQPTSGKVLFDGTHVKGPEENLIPGHPGIAYLSQHFELLNNYRVEEVLEMNNKFNEKNSALIYKVCRIDQLLKRKTNEVSGGEKQRIALARLLVSAPKLLLLDEPYSNLDAIHKNILKQVIEDISEQLQITCLLVSHDPSDVLSWGDEILILQEGKIIQKDTPQHIYNYPVNDYSAALFGKYNILDASLAKAFANFSDIEMNRISSYFRPSHFRFVSNENEGVKGSVNKVLFVGSHYELEIIIGESKIIVYSQDAFTEGDVVFVKMY
jgi:iron(III) transport system ATP-binding protein